jgi:hypothetical protein
LPPSRWDVNDFVLRCACWVGSANSLLSQPRSEQ